MFGLTTEQEETLKVAILERLGAKQNELLPLFQEVGMCRESISMEDLATLHEAFPQEWQVACRVLFPELFDKEYANAIGLTFNTAETTAYGETNRRIIADAANSQNGNTPSSHNGTDGNRSGKSSKSNSTIYIIVAAVVVLLGGWYYYENYC